LECESVALLMSVHGRVARPSPQSVFVPA